MAAITACCTRRNNLYATWSKQLPGNTNQHVQSASNHSEKYILLPKTVRLYRDLSFVQNRKVFRLQNWSQQIPKWKQSIPKLSNRKPLPSSPLVKKFIHWKQKACAYKYKFYSKLCQENILKLQLQIGHSYTRRHLMTFNSCHWNPFLGVLHLTKCL